MISHDHRCIFVHIPKTAGNSVNRVFGVGWQDHKDLQRYHDELPPEDFAAYYKFAIVRNPWDRLFSDYNYQVKKSRAKDSKLFLFTATGSRRNFAEWVEVALAEPDYYEPQRWGGAVSPHIHRWSPQCDWISVAGRPATDFVAHLERLSDDFPVICRQLGLPVVRLPHRNRRLHLHYSHYYDATTRAIVADYYARDIEMFGYEFRHAFLRVSFSWPPARLGAPASGENSPIATCDHADRSPDRVYSFPSALRATARYAWLGRTAFALAASIAIFVRTFTALPTHPAISDRAHESWPQSIVRETVERAVMTDFTPPPGTAVSLAHATRASRALPDLKITVELSPSMMLTLIPVINPTHPAPAVPKPRRSFAPPPNDPRSGSGPAPRWWWHRWPDS